MRKLFYNGDILTMESPRPAEALLTEGGRIIAVGDLSAIAAVAGRHAEQIDLQGGALLPGFADCYSDFGAVVRSLMGGEHGGRAVRCAVRRAEEAYMARGITVLHAADMTEDTARMLSHTDMRLPLMALADIEQYERAKRAAAGLRNGLMLYGISMDLDVAEDGGEASGALAFCDRAVGFAMKMAAAEGVTLVASAKSEASAAQFLRVLKAMSRVLPQLLSARLVLQDARFLSPLMMEQARALGVIPCFAADVLLREGDDALCVWGMERTARITPFASAHRASLLYTLCEGTKRTDPIPNPIALLANAVERKTARGIVPGSGERASVYEALRALTANAAWGYHAEREFGSLRAGLAASFVLLDRSPLSVPMREIGAISVLATWVNGELLSCPDMHEISTRNDRVPSVY